MDANLDLVKENLAVLAAKRNAWDVEWSNASPTEWQPTTVIDPRTDDYFTPISAKEWIAELLRNESTKLEVVTLKKPAGKKAYVIKVPTNHGEIYVKIQFGSSGGHIRGRSFHYSKF